jgi:hypothetical protein
MRVAIAACLLALGAHAQEPIPHPVPFTASNEDFPNPERGFYRYRELEADNDFDVRGDGGSLLFLKLRADAYKAKPFDAAFLDRFKHACEQARQAGVKLIPRVAYNDGPENGCPAEYGCDAPKSIVMGHIAQLAPVWRACKDVIDLVDPGFIGGWGEWHTSSNGLDNVKDEADILFAILDSLPADRMVYVRYPRAKRQIFGGGATSETAWLKEDKAFDRSRVARVGHFNDCFLSGDDDVGTYKDFGAGWPRSREIGFIGEESRYTPYGGETCAVHAKGSCANALAEMAALHIDHLNRDYQPDVIQGWKTGGCYDSISRSLGYRFTAVSARLPDSVKPGGVLEIAFTVRNAGFGELFNPRNVEVTLSGPGGILAAILPEDPRRWAGGTTIERSFRLSVPAGLAEGAYAVGLRLADADPVLAKDPRYSIRFANAGTWEAATGINVLKNNLTVSAKAPGAKDASFSRFSVIDGTAGLEARPQAAPQGHARSWWARLREAARDLRGRRK